VFLKTFTPKNSSLRFRINIDKKNLNLKKFKKLFFNLKNNSGRNKSGQITVRHKGSGLFNFRRNVDIFRNYSNEKNEFISYDIDKKYSCFLGLIKYLNGNMSYIFAPLNLKNDQCIKTTFSLSELKVGYSLPLG
jgi:large subunit ribosomal protein L2